MFGKLKTIASWRFSSFGRRKDAKQRRCEDGSGREGGRGLFLLLHSLALSLSSGRDLRATFNLRRERKIDHILGTEEKRAEEEEGRGTDLARSVWGRRVGLTNTFPPLSSPLLCLVACTRPPAIPIAAALARTDPSDPPPSRPFDGVVCRACVYTVCIPPLGRTTTMA